MQFVCFLFRMDPLPIRAKHLAFNGTIRSVSGCFGDHQLRSSRTWGPAPHDVRSYAVLPVWWHPNDFNTISVAWLSKMKASLIDTIILGMTERSLNQQKVHMDPHQSCSRPASMDEMLTFLDLGCLKSPFHPFPVAVIHFYWSKICISAIKDPKFQEIFWLVVWNIFCFSLCWE